MIEIYKILSGKYDPEVSNFIQLRQDSCTRFIDIKYLRKRPMLYVRKYSFCVRAVTLWNELPDKVVEANTVRPF